MNAPTTSLEVAIWDALAGVADPEIPAVSVVDMGMIKEVRTAGNAVGVTVLPTFTGCPAIAEIIADVKTAVEGVEGVAQVTVDTSFDPPWTTDRITEQGRDKLKSFGLAPPTGKGPVLITEIGLPKHAECPFCGSTNTHNENAFGPTPCRSLYYCDDCRNPFEQFKPV
ncbi:MAG: 1,2-phenylacetyl-CoA epoxidase subunit PaaD [Actinomycetota bacterium]